MIPVAKEGLHLMRVKNVTFDKDFNGEYHPTVAASRMQNGITFLLKYLEEHGMIIDNVVISMLPAINLDGQHYSCPMVSVIFTVPPEATSDMAERIRRGSLEF